MACTRRLIRIEGRVQGVGFRYFALHHANALGVRGYVRNTSDGAVEIDATASSDTIAEYLSILRRGPARARISDISVKSLALSDKYNTFTIKSTV